MRQRRPSTQYNAYVQQRLSSRGGYIYTPSGSLPIPTAHVLGTWAVGRIFPLS